MGWVEEKDRVLVEYVGNSLQSLVLEDERVQ